MESFSEKERHKNGNVPRDMAISALSNIELEGLFALEDTAWEEEDG